MSRPAARSALLSLTVLTLVPRLLVLLGQLHPSENSEKRKHTVCVNTAPAAQDAQRSKKLRLQLLTIYL